MFGIAIPEEIRATVLKEGAGLNDQGLQNLTALFQGPDHSVDRMAAMFGRKWEEASDMERRERIRARWWSSTQGGDMLSKTGKERDGRSLRSRRHLP